MGPSQESEALRQVQHQHMVEPRGCLKELLSKHQSKNRELQKKPKLELSNN